MTAVEFFETLDGSHLDEARIEELPIEQIRGILVGDPPSDALVKSVAKKGVINLPTVRYIAPGVYEVIDGRRRLRALLLNGKAVAEVVVNNNVEDVGGASLVSNYIRSENVIQAAKEVWARMDNGETDKEIAEEEDINIAQIRALRDMRKLLPELIEAVESGQMKSWAARMAARHPAEVQQQLVERLRANGKVTADDVKDVRSVKRVAAVTEVEDLFEDLPELDDEPEADDDGPLSEETRQDLSRIASTSYEPKVKVSRQDRLVNAKELVSQARKELLAIKSNTRSKPETEILSELTEIILKLGYLQDPSE